MSIGAGHEQQCVALLPDWLGICWSAIAPTSIWIWLVGMLGSKTNTFGPKFGAAAAVFSELGDAAASRSTASDTEATTTAPTSATARRDRKDPAIRDPPLQIDNPETSGYPF